jgi:hypothetical protein
MFYGTGSFFPVHPVLRAGQFLCGSGSSMSKISAPAPALACQKFRLRPISPYIFEKKNFHGFKKISCFLKPKTIIKRFFKLKSYEQIFFKTHIQILNEKFRTFCNILYEFTYPEPEPGLKNWAPAPPKSGCSTGSGSATLRASAIHPHQFIHPHICRSVRGATFLL